jgi:hypothetical protein
MQLNLKHMNLLQFIHVRVERMIEIVISNEILTKFIYNIFIKVDSSMLLNYTN